MTAKTDSTTPPTPPLSAVRSDALFSVDPARDWPWGTGDNDNYMNECCSCKKPYRGHKRSIVCCKCQRESDERWAAMTVDERLAHMRNVEEEMAKFCAENSPALPPSVGSGESSTNQ